MFYWEVQPNILLNTRWGLLLLQLDCSVQRHPDSLSTNVNNTGALAARLTEEDAVASMVDTGDICALPTHPE